MNPNLKSLPVRLLALCAALLTVFPARAAVLGPEPFDGPANRPLNGAAIERHDASCYSIAPVWQATPNVVYSSSDDSVTVATDQSGELKIAVPSRREGLLILKADVKVQSADWVGLAFLDSSASNFFHARNTLLVLLNATGQVQVLANGAESLRYTSKAAVPGWQNQSLHTLEVRYDRGAGTVDVHVNGTRMTPEPVLLGPLKSDSFSQVGARMHGTQIKAYDPLVDNFSYSVQQP